MGESLIKSLFEVDEQNRKIVYERVGSASLLPDDVAGLYDLHRIAIATQLPNAAAEIVAALYAACRKHLALGITSLFRCYASQAFRETRAAVEAAGIADAIRRDEESFLIFREDRDEKSRRIARKHFHPANIFVGKLKRLKKFYDKASELSHTNRRTFASSLNVAEQTFSLQDLRPEDIPDLATNYLLWICGAHMEILEVADFVFEEGRGDQIDSLKRERQHIGERLARFSQSNEDRRQPIPRRR